MILDLMLPGLSGWQVFDAFRRRVEVPIIMLTARAEEADRVAGLEMGADDYVSKPFSMRELIARVRAVLRRSARSDEEELQCLNAGRITVDLGRHEVMIDGADVDLTPKEFDLLAYLMQNVDRVRTREEIIDRVWDEEEFLDRRTVDVHVRWLRQKIEADPGNPRHLITVRGVGYKFVE